MKKEILIGVLVLALFLIGCTSPDGSSDSEKEEIAVPEEVVEELPEKVEVEQVEEIVTESVTHTVKFVGTNFEPAELTIKPGDTVVWENARDSPQLNKAMVVGTKKCVVAKSKLLESGETYQYTFNKPMKCEIVDGYITSIMGTIIVEE